VDERLAAGDWANALRLLGPLRRARPKDPEIWRRQTTALRHDGHWSEAKVAAHLWVELDPESIEAHRVLDELSGPSPTEQARAEEQRWAAELRRANLPPQVRDSEVERGGVDPAWTGVGDDLRMGRRGLFARPKTSGGDPTGSPGRPGASSRRSSGRSHLSFVGPPGSGAGAPGRRPRRSRGRRVVRIVVLVIALAALALVVYKADALHRADRSAGQLVVPTEPPVAGQWSFMEKQDGKPVRWDPCRTIHYRVRLGPGPTNGIALVQQAADIVSRDTGLAFVYDGPTDDVPQSGSEHVVLSGPGLTEYPPVTIAWAGPDETNLYDREAASEALGFGGPSAVNLGGTEVYVSGEIVMRPTPDYPSTFGPGATEGNVLLHEFGHLVGLDHVDDPAEVMTPALSRTGPNGYGPGDLRGLWLLGASQGCM
jgi:hypothetical protein